MKRNKPKLAGVAIPGYKAVTDKDGKVTILEDIDAKHRKLDVSTRIAAKAKSETKTRYGKPLLTIPARKLEE